MRHKQRGLLAIAAISLLVLLFDAPLVFYWLKVQLNKTEFRERAFVFRELKLSPTFLGGHRLHAFGTVDGNEERFRPWKAYGSQAYFEAKPVNEKWWVYYDASAASFKIYDKSFRLLSRSEFDAAGFNVAWHLLVVCVPATAVFAVSLIHFRRANQGKAR